MAGNNHSRLHDVNGIKKHKIRAKIISNRKSWQGAAALVFGGDVPLVPSLGYGSDHSPCLLLTSQFFERRIQAN